MGVRATPRQPPTAPHQPVAPLNGFTIAVVSHRRRHALADLAEQAGARTISVQGVRVVPQVDENLVHRATLSCLAAPFDELLVGSAFGFRSWMAAVSDRGLLDRLVARFNEARLLASDARAADGMRVYGLREIWSTAAASSEELFRYLLTHPTENGRRVVAQVDAPSQREACHTLRREGAEVIEVPTFRTLPPNHVPAMRRLIELVIKRQVDAVALTDDLAAEWLLAQAASDNRLDGMLSGLRTDVSAFCLGAGAADVLRAHGAEPIVPAYPFLEEMLDSLVDVVPRRAVRVMLDGRPLEVRGHAVVLDNRAYPVQQGPIDVLRALALAPGRVLSCADIRGAVPGLDGVDDHAIEMAVSRLRRAVPDVDLVQTIIKRGYRLAV